MRKGTVDCFPESKKEAQEMADALAKKLNEEVGGDWEGRIWQNLGWHYDAKLGSISIKQSINPETGEKSYSAYMNNEIGKTGGTPMIYSVPSNYGRSTPEKAIDSVIGAAKDYIRDLEGVIIDNENLMLNGK